MFKEIHKDSIAISKTFKEYFGNFWVCVYPITFLFFIILIITVPQVKESLRGTENVTKTR